MILKIIFIAAILQLTRAAAVSSKSSLFFALLSKVAEGKECTRPGYMCEDCHTSSLCLSLPNGEFHKITSSCKAEQTCSESSGECVDAKLNFNCYESVLRYKFVCRQLGVFPDPFDCAKYHICTPQRDDTVNPESVQVRCKRGFGFDPRTRLCRFRLVNEACGSHRVLFPCDFENSRQTGQIYGNGQLYFMCMDQGDGVITPQMLQCLGDYKYIGFECADPSKQSSIDDNGKCTRKGAFYEPSDCRNYNECDQQGSAPRLQSCDGNMYFDPNTFSNNGCRNYQCNEYTCPNKLIRIYY